MTDEKLKMGVERRDEISNEGRENEIRKAVKEEK